MSVRIFSCMATDQEAFREALRQESDIWEIRHIDITCDGCDREPIVGSR